MSPPATHVEYVYIMHGTGKVKLSQSTPRGNIWDIAVWLHTCLTLALGGGELQHININLM